MEIEQEDKFGFLGLGDEANSADVIESFTTEYMLGLLQQRSRHAVDGLSKVIRRILFSLYGAPKKKIYKHTGQVMDYHPSGDASIAASIAKLMQPWVNAIPLFDYQGGIGSYSGSDAAAVRYLEGMMSQFAKDVFFSKSFEKTLNMVPVDGEDLKEPEYFVPKVPTAFIMGSNVTAKGFRTKAPQYNFNDICELVKYYMDNVITSKDSISDHLPEMAHWLIPDPASHAFLRNAHQIKMGIKEGRFDIPLAFDGVLDIGKSSVIVKSIPPGYPFIKVDNIFKELIRDKKSWLSPLQDSYNDETDRKSSNMWGKARVSLKRTVDVFEHLNKFKVTIGFSQNNVYNYKWLYQGRLCTLLPPQMLEVWSKERITNIGSEYTYSIKSKIEQNRKLKALITIKDDIDEVLKIIQKSEDIPSADKALGNRFGLSLYQASAITSMKTGELTKNSKAELIEKEKQSIQDIKDLNKAFKTIPERIFSEADHLQSKYKSVSSRRCTGSNFQLYVTIKTKSSIGYIQLRDLPEFEKTLSNFPNCEVFLHGIPKGRNYKYVTTEEGIETEIYRDIPKEGSGNVTVSPNRLKYTVKLDKSTICYLTRLHNVGEYGTFVSDKIITIDKKGIVQEVNTTSLPMRKNANATGNLTDIKHVFNIPGKQYYIVHTNPKEKNVIRMSKVTDGTCSLKITSSKSKIHVINKLSHELFMTLPSNVASRLKSQHINIKNPSALFGDKKHIIVNVKKLKLKKSILTL